MHIAAHSRGLIDAGVPLEIFAEFIEGVREQYTAATYNLATNNCNHFSNAVAEFLAGVQVLRPWPTSTPLQPQPQPQPQPSPQPQPQPSPLITHPLGAQAFR